jgi:hypothetical protein
MEITLNEKLSLLIVRYCSAPANERKAVGSTIKYCPTTNGVEIGLTSTIKAHCKRSKAYFV